MKIQRCKICGNFEIEKRTWKKRTWKCTKFTFFTIILLTSLIGSTGLYNFIVGGVYGNYDVILTLGGAYATVENIRSHFQSNDRLEEISFNLTKDCEDTDEYCKSKKIYDHLLGFEYEVGEEPNPLVIWDERECDCDECSFLYKSLLLEQDISSVIQADDTKEHAWIIIKLKNPKKKIMADITKEIWEEK